MPKNSKKSSTDGAAAPASSNEIAPVETAVSAVKKPAKATRKTAAAKKRAPAKSAAKKTSAAAKPASTSSATASPNEPTDAEIRLRAYFIAERRMQLALEGDPANDWIEARKQLRDEAGLA